MIYMDDFNTFTSEIEARMTREIESVSHPIMLGNIIISTATLQDGTNVPAYRYLQDTDQTFYPVYDRHSTCRFGWIDFKECIRIFDNVHSHIETGLV